MKHEQILDKVAFDTLVMEMSDNLSMLINYYFKKEQTPNELSKAILPKFFERWDNVFDDDALSKLYQDKAWLVLATLLHKYGIQIDKITQNAINAIDSLNHQVALSDDFFRKSPQIKEFLLSTPIPLKKRPAQTKAITFFRPKDMIAMHYKNTYYVMYVHSHMYNYDAPVVEFYRQTFDMLPTIDDLTDMKATGLKHNNGNVYAQTFAMIGLKYVQDPANQFHLIDANNHTHIPDRSQITVKTDIGSFMALDIFEIQDYLDDRLDFG